MEVSAVVAAFFSITYTARDFPTLPHTSTFQNSQVRALCGPLHPCTICPSHLRRRRTAFTSAQAAAQRRRSTPHASHNYTEPERSLAGWHAAHTGLRYSSCGIFYGKAWRRSCDELEREPGGVAQIILNHPHALRVRTTIVPDDLRAILLRLCASIPRHVAPGKLHATIISTLPMPHPRSRAR